MQAGAASAEAFVDASALAHNLESLRARASGARVMAVIKADAYGHGAVFAARALRDADAFAVARLEEARLLRAAGIEGRIVLLSGVHSPASLAEACELRVDLGVQHDWQVQLLSTHDASAPFDVWMKVDTGMHRLGLPREEARAAYDALAASSAVGTLRVMTHFACADEADGDDTHTQLARFAAIREALPAGVEVSLANSAGVLGWPASHGDWVRPGIALYGASPFAGGDAGEFGLRPVMRLETPLIATRTVPAGERIGYGGRWTAAREMRVGIAAVGYADGYPRHVMPGAPVLVGGQRCTVVGRVSMDLLAIALDHAPSAQVGERVTLWGPGLPVEQVARAADTIPYTLLAGLTPRVARRPSPAGRG